MHDRHGSFYPSGRRHKLLIVDDEPINRAILSQNLKEDYEILTASNGQEALKFIEAEPDALSLILLTAGWIWWLSKDLIPAMRFPKREPEEEQPQDEDIVPAVAEVMEPAPKPRRERPSTPPTGPVVVDVKDPFPTGEEPATDGSFEIVTDGTLDA